MPDPKDKWPPDRHSKGCCRESNAESPGAPKPDSAEATIRQKLREQRCWDRETQLAIETHGEPLCDCILQNREELVALCRFIQAARVRSYLEIGIWTGRLVTCLHRLFSFDQVAACDHGWAQRLGLPLHLPQEAAFFDGDSDSAAFLAWRKTLGKVDLVFIDGNHNYQAVKRDFAINRAFPHRFLALHDICGANRYTTGVRRFWQELDEGHKLEIVRPHLELGLDRSTMGIGIWSATEPMPWAEDLVSG